MFVGGSYWCYKTAKKQGEANGLAIQKIQGKLDLNTSTFKAQGDAYNVGFLVYLTNFIIADPYYDWSKHFAPPPQVTCSSLRLIMPMASRRWS